MESTTTPRGFGLINFTDSYGNSCSLQKSSSAMEDKIWLGIDNPKLTISQVNPDGSINGKYLVVDMPKGWTVDSRMHLTQEQVINLLPHLIRFAWSGDIEVGTEKAERIIKAAKDGRHWK
jgi:hypothetical protein